MTSGGNICILRSDLEITSDQSSARITNYEHLASYNWRAKGPSTIMVPGTPPTWSPPPGNVILKPDSGTVFIDQNAAKNPQSPLEPLFRALFTQRPLFNIADVDLVTDRNNIRKLLRFATSRSAKAFQVRVEIVDGKTALFTRVERKAKQRLNGNEGFGHNFEKIYTKISPGSSSHHRIATYRFADLKFLIRYEADGHLPAAAKGIVFQNQNKDSDSLSNSLQNFHISDSILPPRSQSTITIMKEGREVEPFSIMEIKTRNSKNSLDMTEVMPQLWISQTPHLAVAYHQEGLFNNVQVQHMTQKICDWELRHQSNLHKLGILLNKIIAAVKAGQSNTATIRYDGGPELHVIIDEQTKALPDDVYARWKPTERGLTTIPFANDKCDHAKRGGLDGAAGDGQSTQMPHNPNYLNPPRQSVTIGGAKYELNISQFPYLTSRVNNHNSGPAAEKPFSHQRIPLFEAAVKGVENGYHECFKATSPNLSSYGTLCKTYTLLGIDVIEGSSPTEIIQVLQEIGGNNKQPDRKVAAQAAAFRLIYFMLEGTKEVSSTDTRNKVEIFDAVVYIVSHPDVFNDKIRKIVPAVYKKRFLMDNEPKTNP